jgi:serine/threonine-protein kinase
MPPQSVKSYTRENYYGNQMFGNYPVLWVNWDKANTYCEWREARLPTEAEWEKAARGTDGRIYPWGSEGVERRFANYDSIVGDTTEVGAYPDGISPYGMYDMGGNVWEWVADWYDPYPGNAVSNPEYGMKYRVTRGGSWLYGSYFLRVSSRFRMDPDRVIVSWYNSLGFRCARDAQP